MSKKSNLADFENMLDLSTTIKSSHLPRWQRKQQQAGAADTSLSRVPGISGRTCMATEMQKSTDRFIPSRCNQDDSRCDLDDSCIGELDAESSDYSRLLQQNINPNNSNINNSDLSNSRVLAFKDKAPAATHDLQSKKMVLYSQQTSKKAEIVKSKRHIPSAPVRVLDAPDLMDDYYLNLLSWGSENVLAVALSQAVYLWDASSGTTKELMNVESDANDDYVSSVSWIQQGGTHIAVGTASNSVQLWDVQAQKCIRKLEGHTGRVGALAWNGHMLTSGSFDTTILNHDVRVQNHVIGRMAHHTQEVCGLAWSPDSQYLASGANDNTLCIWDAASTLSMDATPKHVLTDHQAAVKALAWSPHERNLLASGGGTADRCIKFWNASSGALMNSIDTGSQVCALQWSPFEKEILSSHGYAENQLCLWKYPSMACVKQLKGHTARVLHMATSPDGSMVVSCAADETLKFWNVFASEGKRKADGPAGTNSGLSLSSGIR